MHRFGRLSLGGMLAASLLLAAASAQGGLANQEEIKVDGSSTVYLITEAVAANYRKLHPSVRVSLGISGTGGGFKKFAAGEIDINDASRPIRPAETAACKQNGIDFLELQIAWDGVAVLIHAQNTWARQLTVEQLQRIWRPDSPARLWSDVEPGWPAEEIRLFGAGPDSGTFDFFTEAINGKEKSSRRDYQSSEDDNNIAQGVAGNRFALGYFGLAYLEANRARLAAAAIAVMPDAPYVLPSRETVLKGTYKPLSRPLFLYVKTSSLRRPEVQAFLRFYLRRADLVEAARYVRMSHRQQTAQQDRLEQAITGFKAPQ